MPTLKVTGNTFCTPECRKTIDNYLDYRRQCGENITGKSPLFRREFDKRDIFQVANDVKPLTRNSIKTALRQVLYASGIRTPLVKEKNFLNSRRDIAMSHGFRKFFDTNATHSDMNPIYIDWCLGHSLKGVKDSYFLPQPDANGVYIDILEGHDAKSPGYIDAIPSLTINEENRLRRENEMLKIKKSEIEQLKQRDKTSADVVATMQEQLIKLQDEQAKQQKLFLATGLRDQKLRERPYNK